MIKTILDLLKEDNYWGVSERIDIGKGLYQKPTSFRELIILYKRLWYGRKY